MNNLISVVVPVYNAEKTIRRCIESVLIQDYSNFELILIDDGSQDTSLKICKSYHDNRIKVIHRENKGVSITRNEGINVAKGKYIFFIDSDDYIRNRYFSSLLNIKNDENVLTMCQIEGLEFNNNFCETLVDFSNLDKKVFLQLNKDFLLYGPVAKLYDLGIIKKNNILFPEDISFGEDLLFNFQYLRCVDKIKYTDKTSYFYDRSNEISLSQKYRKNRYENEIILFNALYDFFVEKNILDNDSKEYLYGRIFDSAYNSIADIYEFEKNFRTKLNMVSKILNDKILKESYCYIKDNKYSKYITILMKRNYPILLFCYFKLGTIKNKECG